MNSGTTELRSVGIIGSFKQHYIEVLEAARLLSELGLRVSTPKGGQILKEGIDFVRFDTDFPSYDDPTIQSVTLHRLFGADFVYVVAPQGYIGRTTCYEVGRLLHAGLPVYFSDKPHDFPIKLPKSHTLTLEQLVSKIEKRDFVPSWPFLDESLGLFGELEKEIVSGKYRNM